MLNVRSVI